MLSNSCRMAGQNMCVEVRMKRLILFIGMFALLGGLMFAAGDKEPEGVELFIAGYPFEIPDNARWIAPFVAAHPDVKLTEVMVNVDGATTISMDYRI